MMKKKLENRVIKFAREFCKNENSIVFIKRWKTKNLKKLKQIQKEKKH